MNGAESLIRTLLDGGVDTCFMNPGTSEIHFVSALDSYPEMRSILCLFEGVATGCADGYARIAENLPHLSFIWARVWATAFPTSTMLRKPSRLS